MENNRIQWIKISMQDSHDDVAQWNVNVSVEKLTMLTAPLTGSHPLPRLGESYFIPTEPEHARFNQKATNEKRDCVSTMNIETLPKEIGLVYIGIEKYEYLPEFSDLSAENHEDCSETSEITEDGDESAAEIVNDGTQLTPEMTRMLHHFNLFPTTELDESERTLIAGHPDAFEMKLGEVFHWYPYTIKDAAQPTVLKNRSKDLHGISDYWIVHLYQISAIFYRQTKDSINKLWANIIHTWIALSKPTWHSLKEDGYKAYRVFRVCCEVDLRDDAYDRLDTVRNQMVSELSTIYGWERIRSRQ